MRSEDSSQQGGEPEVNLNNLYQTGFMKKTKEADTIKLKKKTLAKKFKNIKEVKIFRRDHVSSRLGKGKVNIISEKVTEEDLTLTETERIAREKRDKELDELNA
ncbi:unnamed protein product [Lactuca virosa]|uniref:Uncharacterized protein n=1 Tax=Lactuca virosa TaxID=75947 RepID=A0AAU9PP51_9ASTR|nr:unnamed protein product [Lactuca virosa]